MEYTKKARQILADMKKLATKAGSVYIGSEHLLLALTKNYSGTAGQILAEYNVKKADVERVMSQLFEIPQGEETQVEYSVRLEEMLEKAENMARRFGMEKVGTEALLLAIVDSPMSAAFRILSSLKADPVAIKKATLALLGEEDYADAPEDAGEMLDRFTVDLTERAREGFGQKVFGREKEMERIMQILSCRSKNNPCLIGAPGVGKTAIVYGLAERIAEGNVPEFMKDKKLLRLDISDMVAGTKFRGEFEERFGTLLDEIAGRNDVILFVDEVHMLVGAGAGEGAMDAANILKPAMADGAVKLIGATTPEEYTKYIEKDAALERRFKTVEIEEPSHEECLFIMENMREMFEKHHHVTITDDALKASVNYAGRYIPDRALPDKALDALDEACARARLKGQREQKSTVLSKTKIQDLKKAFEERDFDVARALYKERDLKVTHSRRAKKAVVVSEASVAEVIAMHTGIPVSKLTEKEARKLANLEDILGRRVKGQTEAIEAVSKAVRRGRTGLKDPKRPVGSFLFLGPTGVGKTELARALSEALFGTEDAMIRIDMSEYMEKHSVSRLIGAPPGYVGHDEGGQLSDAVRRRPYSVVLFDEIEKAHRDVFNVLLQVLDDGQITDAKGRRIDFKNTLIIMTSNAGATAIVEPKTLGFVSDRSEKADYERMKDNVMAEVRKAFRPEFLNRIDVVTVFHALNDETLLDITALMCQELSDRVKENLNICLKVCRSAQELVKAKGDNKKFGARPLRRQIQTLIEDPLAEKIVSGEIREGSDISVMARDEKISFRINKK